MIPVEVGVNSPRRTTYNQDQNHDFLRTELDLIEERRDNSQLKVTAYQNRVARHFNLKVQEKCFKVGDLVLRKVTPNIETKGSGVLSLNWEGPYRISFVIRPGSYKLERLSGKVI